MKMKQPWNFAEFMTFALYDADTGYYSANISNIGTSGDFLTAPTLSIEFSHCLARQCEQVLKHLGQGDILEIGAGTGDMALGILSYLKTQNSLPSTYKILERSPKLKKVQQEKLTQALPEFADRIHWLDQAPATGFEGIILGNEVLDALPVHLFEIRHEQLIEIGVTQIQDAWTFCPLEEPNHRLIQEVTPYLRPLSEYPSAFRSEICLELKPFIQTQTAALQRGLVLWIDYGYEAHDYYHPQRSTGTLRCHFQHQTHDNPLIRVGQQDITAHVNFTAVADAALDTGLTLSGYTTQAIFLINCGIESSLLSNTHRLLHPQLMGEQFKVMGLSRDLDLDLIGFRQGDIRHRL